MGRVGVHMPHDVDREARQRERGLEHGEPVGIEEGGHPTWQGEDQVGPDAVPQVLGRAPVSFARWSQDHADVWR